MGVLHSSSQLLESPRSSRLDGAPRNFEGERCLVLTQSKEETAHYDQPIFLREFFHRIEGDPRLLHFKDDAFRGWVGHLGSGIRSDTHCQTETSSSASSAIGGLVANDCENPGTERRVFSKAPYGAVSTGERLLGYILRLGMIANQEISEPKGGALMYAH
jgi:hypothetical protein